MAGLSDIKPGSSRERVDLSDVIDMIKLPKNKWVEVRFLPLDSLSVHRHWVNIVAGKDKREVSIPKMCVAHDGVTGGSKKGVTCPYCELAGQRDENFFLFNVIVRSIQEDGPGKKAKLTSEEKKSGFKSRDSDSWTPVRVLRVTSSLARKLQGLADLNKVKGKEGTKTYSIDHAKFGCSVSVKHDPDAKGPEQYQVQKGDRSPLTDEEKAYLVYELTDSLLDQIGRETVAEAKKELGRMQLVSPEEFDTGDDDDDDDVSSKKSKKSDSKSKSASKKKSKDEDDDDDDDVLDDGDEDEKPAKSKKKKSKDEDEEDEEDEDDPLDDDDEDEDEKPVKSKKSDSKSKSKSASKKKSKDEDEDEDEDEDDDLLDDDDDEDDDDDYGDDDDDDDD